MKKSTRFYSKQETSEVTKLAESGKPVNNELTAEFCKKYNRSPLSVMIKIYSIRNKKKSVRKPAATTPNINLTKGKTNINLSKGQFRIPISSWDIKNEDGKFYFVAQF